MVDAAGLAGGSPVLHPGATAAKGPARLRRVLVVNRVGFLGGVERIILTLAEGLEAFGWQPVIASPVDGALARAASEQGTALAPCDFDRMRITGDPLALARYPFAWVRGAAAIERACCEHSVEVIHVHHPVTALYALRASMRLGLPIVLHVHETLPAKPLYAVAMRTVIRRVASVVCVSRAALSLALAMGADPLRTEVVPNGVDRRFLEGASRHIPAAVRNAGPGPHVGVFGVLEPRKAQHVLLQAAATIVSRFPSARFWLIGPAALKDKQAYADTLRRIAGEAPLAGRVSLVGFQPDITAWLAAMDVVVQPSVALESFGMSLAEALTLGRPVIASDVGGMPETVRDRVTGLIVPAGNALALAAGLSELLESPEQRLRLGRQGAVDARERFAPDRFQRRIAAAYAAVAGAP